MKQLVRIFLTVALLVHAAHIISYDKKYRSCDDICHFSSDKKRSVDQCCYNTCDDHCGSLNSLDFCNDCDNSCDTRCNQLSPLRNNSPVRTQIYYRSVGDNIARQLVGWQWELYRPDCENYGTMYIAYEYQRTFKSEPLIKPLLGSNILDLQGSLVQCRQPNAVIADNFGLGRQCSATVTFCPRIENHIVDFGFYAGLNSWCDGLFLLIHAPVVHTRWDLNWRCNARKVARCTSTEFSQCFVSSAEVTRGSDTEGEGDNLNPAFSASTIEQALSGTFLFGDMQTPWKAARFPICRRSETALANIDFNIGYNWLLTDCYHFGGFVRLVAPTGNRVNQKYIFSPQAGNGHHWELGVGLTAHDVLWTSEDANLSIWFEGYLTHMFNDQQCRTFDLCNGALSRYILLKEYQSNGSEFIYNGNLISANNFTTRHVNVGMSVKGDAAFKLAYRWCGWGFDLGYEVYGNDHENIERICTTNTNLCERSNVKYGIKGTETVCCNNFPVLEATIDGTDDTIKFLAPNGTEVNTVNMVGDIPVNNPGVPEDCDPITQVTVQLARNNTNQPNANMFTPILGTNRTVPPIADDACTVCLSPDGTEVSETVALSNVSAENGYIISNTGTPQFLDEESINYRSAEAPSVLSHKIFGHVNYTWLDDCGWNPHVGIGFEVEFDGKSNNKDCVRDTRNTFDRLGFNQWGIWIKGGMSF